MRAPGENPGLFALESALDELAYLLNMDPVELRIVNHADVNEQARKPWSSKYLKECYQMAAERFGWAKRAPQPGSMRDGNLLVGWGMATATFPGIRSPGAAKVRLLQDGSVNVISATQDMGGGTYTTMAQIAADVMGIAIERIRTVLGDSLLPPAPVSGGSMTTASILPATRKAARDALSKLRQLAATIPASPFTNRPDDIVAEGGRVFPMGDPASGLAYEEVLKRTNRTEI